MKPDDPITQNTNRQIRILGICWIIYGVVRLFDAVWLVSFSNTATVMFGALLARVRDPFAMMTNFHFIYASIEALSVICGVLGIFAGWTLLAGQGFGRTLALIGISIAFGHSSRNDAWYLYSRCLASVARGACCDGSFSPSDIRFQK